MMIITVECEKIERESISKYVVAIRDGIRKVNPDVNIIAEYYEQRNKQKEINMNVIILIKGLL